MTNLPHTTSTGGWAVDRGGGGSGATGFRRAGVGAAAGAAVTVGFATAVAMWCAWLVAHHPALGLPIHVTGPGLLVLQLACMVVGGRALTRAEGAERGLRLLAWSGAAGLVTGLVNLLILGSKLAQPVVSGETATAAPGLGGLHPAAALMVGGFLVLSAAIGLVGGGLGGLLGRIGGGTSAAGGAGVLPPERWLARFATVAAVSVVPLLTLGGLVTSKDAGMAVPDWPGTYGANMFLYPIALMGEPRIYLEHTHRLFGTLVGLSTVVLAAYSMLVDRRDWVRFGVGPALLLAVITQGVMGGMRVSESSLGLAVVHGVLAQVYFAGMVAMAAVLTPAFVRLGRSQAASEGRLGYGPALVCTLLGALLLQLLFGAVYRHLRHGHALWTHVGFAFVVMVLAVVVGAWTSGLPQRLGWAEGTGGPKGKPAEGPETAGVGANLRRIGWGLTAAVVVQFLFGWVTLLVLAASSGLGPRDVPTADELVSTPAGSTLAAVVRTTHQANGALVLALATLAAVWVLRVAHAIGPSTPAERPAA